MTDVILTGTNPAADKRLMQDIQDAEVRPDDFEGGCPADTLPATSYQAKLIEREKENAALRAEQDRKYDQALKELVAAAKAEGVRLVIAWMDRTGNVRTSTEIRKAHERGEIVK
jgi:hypothetical protein